MQWSKVLPLEQKNVISTNFLTLFFFFENKKNKSKTKQKSKKNELISLLFASLSFFFYLFLTLSSFVDFLPMDSLISSFFFLPLVFFQKKIKVMFSFSRRPW